MWAVGQRSLTSRVITVATIREARVPFACLVPFTHWVLLGNVLWPERSNVYSALFLGGSSGV